jgi:pyridoxine kinase
MILILSSFVAASPVGGGAQVMALAALETRAILAPTVLFGRHPGLGPPGGGAVSNALFEGILEGVAASGAYESLDAVITGYFADRGQIAAAGAAIDAIRALRPKLLVVTDPIMGDSGKGLYVSPAVAAAQGEILVPRADLVSPNAWELQRLTACVIADPASALIAAREVGRPVLVSSVPMGRNIGVLWTDGEEAWLASHRKGAGAPNGTGDLLTALFTAALLEGASGPDALETAVSDVAAQVLGAETPVTMEAL